MTEPSPPQPRIALLVWAAGLAVLLLASPILLVRFFLTREWMESRVMPVIEETVGREIEFERLRVGFRGLVLEKLVVAEHPDFARVDDPAFATLERLVLSVRWKHLLRGRVVINGISLDTPVIFFHRNASGVINISDSPLLAPEPIEAPADDSGPDGRSDDAETAREEAPGDDEQEGKREAEEEASAPMRLDPKWVRVHNGRIVWLDASAEAAPARIELRRVYLTAEGVSTQRPFKADASMELSAGASAANPIQAAAQFDLPNAGVKVLVIGGTIDADAYAVAIAAAREREREREAEAAPMRTAGDRMASVLPDIEASISLDRIVSRGLSFEAPRVTLRYHERLLEMTKARALVDAGEVSATGAVDWRGRRPVYRANLALAGVPVATAASLAGIAADGRWWRNARGTLHAAVSYSGPGLVTPDDLRRGALPKSESLSLDSLRFDDASIAFGGPSAVGVFVSDLHASVEDCVVDRPCTMQARANMVAGGSDPTHAQGTVTWSMPASTLDLDLAFDRFDLDAVREALASPASGGSGTPTPTTETEAPPPSGASDRADDERDALPPFRFSATVKADAARIAGIEVRALRAGGEYLTPTLQLHELVASVGEGELFVKGSAEFLTGASGADRTAAEHAKSEAAPEAGTTASEGGPDGSAVNGAAATTTPAAALRGEMRLRDADLPTLMAGLWAPRLGDLSGRVAGTASLTASWPDWRSTLDGTADVQIPQGRWNGGILLDNLATAASLEPLTQFEIRDSGGKLRLGDGRVASDRFILLGREVRVVASGGIDWNGAMEIDARVGLSPSAVLASGLPGKDWKKERDGWGTVPVRLRGTLAEPRANLPLPMGDRRNAAESVTRSVGRSVTRGAGRVLQGLEDLLRGGLGGGWKTEPSEPVPGAEPLPDTGPAPDTNEKAAPEADSDAAPGSDADGTDTKSAAPAAE